MHKQIVGDRCGLKQIENEHNHQQACGVERVLLSDQCVCVWVVFDLEDLFGESGWDLLFAQTSRR